MERDCRNCRFEHYEADEIPCIHCGMDTREYWQPKPKTKADRIRAMTDEELAGLFGKYVYCGLCPLMHRCIAGECNKVVMGWLQQPAKEDNDENRNNQDQG